MKHNIRGILTIEVSGDNIYKFINSVRDNNIVCTSQHCKNSHFYAQIYSRDIDAVRLIADNSGVQLSVIHKTGLKFTAYAYRFRFGIFIGIVLALAFAFYLSNTVVSIEVCGNTSITEQQVVDALEEIGIRKGRFIPDIDFHSSEQRLRLSIPQIAWTGIRHTGSRIVVDITEVVPKPDMVNDDIPCNIISSKDAQISYAEVYSGQMKRKTGDAIKTGDVLISGIVNDSNGGFLKKHAKGKVLGIYREQVTFEQPFEQSGQIFSDYTETRKYFDFFGFRIPLFFSGVKAQTFDYSENTTKFSVFNKEIPLGIVHCKYQPFTYDTITFSPEEADLKLQQQTSRYEKNFFDTKNITILERNIHKSVTDDKMIYSVSYLLEGDICQDQEIFVD